MTDNRNRECNRSKLHSLLNDDIWAYDCKKTSLPSEAAYRPQPPESTVVTPLNALISCRFSLNPQAPRYASSSCVFYGVLQPCCCSEECDRINRSSSGFIKLKPMQYHLYFRLKQVVPAGKQNIFEQAINIAIFVFEIFVLLGIGSIDHPAHCVFCWWH
jgi:hypothetical protein